jgi:DNA-directed RNA polymerase specialized sigma subunit
MTEAQLQEMIESAVENGVKRLIQALKSEGLITKPSKSEQSAYQKTETLLYNYPSFKRIVDERMQEIEELRKFGVPSKSGSIMEYSAHGGTPQGIVLEEESVEAAVRNVQASVQGTVQVIALIDKCMAALKNDPYYRILEMRYFEGRTQEDIAITLKCAQQTISKNKNRLVRELSIRLFPNQVADEMIK